MKAKIIRPFDEKNIIDQSWIDLGEADVYRSKSWMFDYFFHWPEKNIVACIDSDMIVIEITEPMSDYRTFSDQKIPEIVMKHRNNLVTRVGPLGGFSCAMISSSDTSKEEKKEPIIEEQVKDVILNRILLGFVAGIVIIILAAAYCLLR